MTLVTKNRQARTHHKNKHPIQRSAKAKAWGTNKLGIFEDRKISSTDTEK